MELITYVFYAFTIFWIIGTIRLYLVSRLRLEAIDLMYDTNVDIDHTTKLIVLFEQRKIYDQALALHKWTFKQFYPEWPNLKKEL